MTRVAAVDCGTNSVRLLVADEANGRLTDVVREMRIVRLGQDVDRTGRLAPRALERTFEALREYAALIDLHGASRVRMVATSATRDASNSGEFVNGCTEILAAKPDVVSGDEEARLSFLGATNELGGYSTPYLVVDVGGGSTELVLGAVDPEGAASVDVGCVRLTERWLRSDPPTAEEVEGAVADVRRALDSVDESMEVARARTLVGVAGSVTTVAAISLGLEAYDPHAIHLTHVSLDQVEDITDTLLRQTREERSRIGAMHPGRVDVIGAGALVLREIMRRWNLTEVVASERDILDGIAYGVAAS